MHGLGYDYQIRPSVYRFVIFHMDDLCPVELKNESKIHF